MNPLHKTSFQWETAANTFVKKVKYTVSLLWNRVMNCFCRRKWWHQIDCLQDKNIIILSALPLRRRFFKSDLARMKALGVQTVFTFTESFERKKGIAGNPITAEDWKKAGIENFEFPTPDYEPLSQDTLEGSADCIHKARQQGKTILIHCKGGKGRSVAGLSAYFIKYHPKTIGKTPDHAIRHIRKSRRHISMRLKQRTPLMVFHKNIRSIN